jgi:hypothetical protein
MNWPVPTLMEGLLALGIGIGCDWQKYFPKIGDRIAALMALVVGATIVAHTKLGVWLASGAGWVNKQAGHLANSVDPHLGAIVATSLAGVLLLAVFIAWVMMFLPSRVSSVVGPAVNKGFDSRIIWAGMAFPALAVMVPGNGILHGLFTWVVNAGAGAGTWIVGRIV